MYQLFFLIFVQTENASGFQVKRIAFSGDRTVKTSENRFQVTTAACYFITYSYILCIIYSEHVIEYYLFYEETANSGLLAAIVSLT